MIGQIRLLQQLEMYIADEIFPGFSVIVGPDGSGKKTIAHYVGKSLKYAIVEVGIGIADIRNLIENAYRIQSETLYIIADADTMSIQARNALLKIAEQPCNKAHIIMTLSDINNTLPTIKSRAVVFNTVPYTNDELKTYIETLDYRDSSELILKACSTPGDIRKLIDHNPKQFYEFVEKVVDNIATTSGSNAFKIGKSIKFKQTDEEGYDLTLFWRLFNIISAERFKETEQTKWLRCIRITSSSICDLRNKSINRMMLFDKWILDIRKELR